MMNSYVLSPAMQVISDQSLLISCYVSTRSETNSFFKTKNCLQEFKILAWQVLFRCLHCAM